jgi:hypothetical protein
MDWQQLVVYLIVAAAALYLAWGALRKKRAGCGGCGSCASASAPPESPKVELVQLDPAPRPIETEDSRRQARVR